MQSSFNGAAAGEREGLTDEKNEEKGNTKAKERKQGVTTKKKSR